MWQYFIYALVFLLGWYLYPFDGRVRNAINALVMKLVYAIVDMLQGKQGTSKGKTTRTTSLQTPQRSYSQPKQTYGGRICPKCNQGLLQPVTDGYLKGSWFCPVCEKLESK